MTEIKKATANSTSKPAPRNAGVLHTLRRMDSTGRSDHGWVVSRLWQRLARGVGESRLDDDCFALALRGDSTGSASRSSPRRGPRHAARRAARDAATHAVGDRHRGRHDFCRHGERSRQPDARPGCHVRGDHDRDERDGRAGADRRRPALPRAVLQFFRRERFPGSNRATCRTRPRPAKLHPFVSRADAFRAPRRVFDLDVGCALWHRSSQFKRHAIETTSWKMHGEDSPIPLESIARVGARGSHRPRITRPFSWRTWF